MIKSLYGQSKFKTLKSIHEKINMQFTEKLNLYNSNIPKKTHYDKKSN